MGVINLSVLVDKIKRKLINGGFITSSDKASKSKFGIVKVGDGINVNSGIISVSAQSGGTVVLWQNAGTNIPSEWTNFTGDATGCKMIVGLSTADTYDWMTHYCFINTALIPADHDELTAAFAGGAGSGNLRVTRDFTKFKQTDTSGGHLVTVLGIK